MKRVKTSKPAKPREIAADKLGAVVGGAGTGATLGPHPNPPVGPGG